MVQNNVYAALRIREGLQIGVWTKKFVAVAPMSAISACVLGMGVAPWVGNELPSIWSWSSVRNQLRGCECSARVAWLRTAIISVLDLAVRGCEVCVCVCGGVCRFAGPGFRSIGPSPT